MAKKPIPKAKATPASKDLLLPEAGHSEWKSHGSHFNEIALPNGDAEAYHSDFVKADYKKGTPAHAATEALESAHKEVTRLKEKDTSSLPESAQTRHKQDLEKAEKRATELGKTAHSHNDRLAESNAKARDQLREVYDKKVEELGKKTDVERTALSKAKTPAAQATHTAEVAKLEKEAEALTKEFEKKNAHFGEVEKLTQNKGAKIAEQSGVERAGGKGGAVAKAGAKVAGAEKSFTKIFKESASGKLFSGKIGNVSKEKAFGEMGFARSATAKIGGNIGSKSVFKKGVGAVGLGSALYFAGKLAMDTGRVVGIVPNQRDGNGEEKAAGFSNVLLDAAGVAASVAVGGIAGKGHAMGISH